MQIEPMIYLGSAFLVGVFIVAWKAIGAIEHLADSGGQVARDERRDMYSLLERLVEKRDAIAPQHVTSIHAQERMHRITEDSETERAGVVAQVDNAGTDDHPEQDPYMNG